MLGFEVSPRTPSSTQRARVELDAVRVRMRSGFDVGARGPDGSGDQAQQLVEAADDEREPERSAHLSAVSLEPTTREAFRHLSYVGMAAAKTVEGHGADSYRIALEAVASGEV